MKKAMIFLLFLLFYTSVFSQQKQEVVYLKNGSIIRGEIIEQIPNETIKIMTADRSVFVYRFDEIEKITKEEIAMPTINNSGSFSYGIAIGGGGLFGVPLRYKAEKNLTFELGLYYRPVIVNDRFSNDDIELFGGVMLAGGVNHFMREKHIEHKGKHRKHGVFFKAGHSFSDFTDSFLAGGWASETFRVGNEKRSFIFELGPGVIFNSWVDDPGKSRYNDGVNKVFPLIYWKVNWNWYN